MGDGPDELLNDLLRRFPSAEMIGGEQDYEQLVATVVGFVEAPQLGLSLPLDVRGTLFQQRVWQALREIPVGSTVSYSGLAQLIGAPKSARAVAQACAANALAVAIPCHRVVRTVAGCLVIVGASNASVASGKPGVNIGCGPAVVAMNSWSVQCRYRPGFARRYTGSMPRYSKVAGCVSARRAKACNGRFTGALLSSFRLKSQRTGRHGEVSALAQFEAMLRHMLGLSQDVATSNNMQTIRSAVSPAKRIRCRAASPSKTWAIPANRSGHRGVSRWLLVPQAFAIGGLLLPTAPQVPH
jgi:O-6-methylguanine DNA methyltransferase